MSLVATAGASNANSYVTRDAATAYFNERMYSSKWEDADPTDQEKALITATRRIDQETFVGLKVTTTQSLKWPRYDTADDDGNTYAGDAIPQRVKDAVCELALELLSSDALKESQLVNFAQLKIGPLEITPQQPQKSGALPAQVRRLLAGLLSTPAGTVRMVRG